MRVTIEPKQTNVIDGAAPVSARSFRWQRLGWSVAFAGMAVTLAGGAGAQTDNERAAARTAAEAGDAAYKAGHYQQAADYFDRAEHIMHAPTLLLFVARSHARLGHYVKARESYIKVTREVLGPGAPAAFRTAQESARSELPDIEAKIARVTITVDGAPPSALTITVDGAAVPSDIVGLPVPIDPGKHTVQASAAGHEPSSADFAVKEAESGQVHLTLIESAQAPATPIAEVPGNVPQNDVAPAHEDKGTEKSDNASMRIGAYVGFGVGAVGVALGTVFLVQHFSKQSDSDKAFNTCAGKTGECLVPAQQKDIASKDKDAATAGTVSIVSYAIGGVGLAAGITLWVLQGSDHSEKASVRPYFTGTGGGLVGRF